MSALSSSFVRKRQALLFLHSDPALRGRVCAACAAAGIEVRSAGAIAEIERWPVGEIVITALPLVTAWWQQIGAMHVVALVADVGEGVDALDRGATGWLVGPHTAQGVTSLAVTLAGHADSEVGHR